MAREKPVPNITTAPAPQASLGALRTQARLTIHTRQAQALYLGRERQAAADGEPEKRGITGLEGFARLAAQIANAAAEDDPYADLALLKVEDALAVAEKAVRADIRLMTGPLESMPGMEVDLSQSLAPLQLPFMIASPYGAKGAYLLHDFDELMRVVLTAQRCALVDRERAYSFLLRAGRPLRRVYGMPLLNWRHTGATRRDVREDTRLARQAREVYAPFKILDIPDDVLQGTRRPRFAPPIRKAPARPAASYLEIEEDGK